MHAPTHTADAPKGDQNENSVVVEFMDKYITFTLPDETKYPKISNLVKRAQTHRHTTTCRKKKGIACRFNAPWVWSDKTRIVHSEEKIDETIVKQSKSTFLYYYNKWSICHTIRNFGRVWSYNRTVWQCNKVCGKKVLYDINANHVK